MMMTMGGMCCLAAWRELRLRAAECVRRQLMLNGSERILPISIAHALGFKIGPGMANEAWNCLNLSSTLVYHPWDFLSRSTKINHKLSSRFSVFGHRTYQSFSSGIQSSKSWSIEGKWENAFLQVRRRALLPLLMCVFVLIPSLLSSNAFALISLNSLLKNIAVDDKEFIELKMKERGNYSFWC